MSESEEPGEEEQMEQEDPRERRLPTMQGRRDLEMDAIGWLIFAAMLIVLIPLLPAVILALIIAELMGLTGRRRLSWPRPTA